MESLDLTTQVMAAYPKIFFACHTRHVRDSKSGVTISAHQASILDHLDTIEPTALNELARHMGVTASTMCLTVDRLVRAGYALRTRDASDARRVALRLTRSGARLRDQKTVLDPQLVRSMLSKIAPTQRREAVRGLELLAQAASESVAARQQRKTA